MSPISGLAEATAVQLRARPGVVELGFGQPDPALLPRDAIRSAAEVVLSHTGTGEALAYGAERGPGELLGAIADRIGETERRPSENQLLVTGGNSQALDELMTHLTSPGDSILVEAPTYNFALAIMRSHGVYPVGVEVDQEGIRVTRLEEAFNELAHHDRRPKLLYLVPTFHNPSGITLSDSRRQELISFAADRNLLIIEDDAYRELFYDGANPESLWSIDPNQVIRLGTVSKSLAPGLRVGWMTASERLTKALELAGLRQSGGGVNHFSSMVVAEVIHSGSYAAELNKLRVEYKARRDALVDGLQSFLDAASFETPNGGYFIWLGLPSAIDSAKLLPLAEAEGVSFVPGHCFFPDAEGGRSHLRLGFSYYEPDVLREGAARLARAVRGL